MSSCFRTRARTFEQYLQTHCGDLAVVSDLTRWLRKMLHETDATAPKFTTPEYWDEAMPYLNWLMDRDRKSTALKSLQGRIWKGGFERDELKGTLFEDVPGAGALVDCGACGDLFFGVGGGAASAVPAFKFWRSDAVDFGLFRYADRAEDSERQLQIDRECDGLRASAR